MESVYQVTSFLKIHSPYFKTNFHSNLHLDLNSTNLLSYFVISTVSLLIPDFSATIAMPQVSITTADSPSFSHLFCLISSIILAPSRYYYASFTS